MHLIYECYRDLLDLLHGIVPFIMEFNNHDLNDFNAKLKSYNKHKRISKHKQTRIGNKETTHKEVSGFLVKVIKNEPAVEKITEPSSTEFFNTMMRRHKRRNLIK